VSTEQGSATWMRQYRGVIIGIRTDTATVEKVWLQTIAACRMEAACTTHRRDARPQAKR
jgi:hypothetical protein